MIVEIKIPSPGESISEVEIASWAVENGDFVEKNQEIAEIESDKATLPLIASESGKIEILAQVGDTVAVGSVACKIDTSVAGQSKVIAATTIQPEVKVEKQEKQAVVEQKASVESTQYDKVKVSPLAKKLMDEYHLNVDEVINGLQRLGKKEVELFLENKENLSKAPETVSKKISTPNNYISLVSRELNREKMSSLRRKLSERLVAVKNETAMLTTFNELDMSAVMDLRNKYQKSFVDKYGVKVGFMSFFLKATAQALKAYPSVNAMIDGDEVVYYDYSDIGIAVQSAKGLLVPVLRNVESMSLADIELKIKEFAEKGKNNKITLDEMSGGTFTITNGGTFGSLMSTPIINPPQSGILGMHNILERPVAINGKVEIRPMMYIALSYDHRIIDGKSAVGFLVAIKNLIENPYKMLLGGTDENRTLLGI
jgi:2-oxoglutarate dehydrogenase E2 component (dihydrolipoamide succinyltransferase)